MGFIKCKSEAEKLDAIKRYCKVQIMENNRRIKWFEAKRVVPLDYVDEIDELRTRNAHFEKIIEIINADEYTSVMIF